MFGSLGFPELLMIFAVALIVFGPKRLPEIGRTLGKALGEFKKATEDLKSSIEREVRIDELKQIPTAMMIPPADTVPRVEPLAASAVDTATPASATTEPRTE